jgi:membrane-associated phospholipid phosphatase
VPSRAPRRIPLVVFGVITPLLVFAWLARTRRTQLLNWDDDGFALVRHHTRGHLAASVMRVTDTYGGWTGQVVAVGVAVIALLLLRRFADSLFVALAAVVGHELLSYVKPALASTYPSGHAMGAMVVGAAVAIVAWRTHLRWLFLFSAAGAIFLTGVSRIYTGAHYPSDVIGGWALGLACVVAISLIRWVLQERLGQKPV